MSNRTLPQLSYVVLINEVEPRNKKYGVTIPAETVGKLVYLELQGIITRRELREMLDHMYEMVQSNV